MWSDLLDNNVSFLSVGIIRFVEYLEIKGIWLYFVCGMGCKANNANVAYLDVVRHICMSGMRIMAISKTGSSVECVTKHTKLWSRLLNVQSECNHSDDKPKLNTPALHSWYDVFCFLVHEEQSVVERIYVFEQYMRGNITDSFSPTLARLDASFLVLKLRTYWCHLLLFVCSSEAGKCQNSAAVKKLTV